MPPAPPPLKKPGRISVYSSNIDHEQKTDSELGFIEGDLLFVEEDATGSELLKARTSKGSGTICRSFVTNGDLTLIDHPLHEAAKRGNEELVQEYLGNNVSVNSLDRSGSTALYWAAFGGHLDVVQMLLNVPNINTVAQNKLGDTAIHAASRKGHFDCLKTLVESPITEASVHTRNSDGKTAYEVAATPETEAFLQVAMRKIAQPADMEEYLSSDED